MIFRCRPTSESTPRTWASSRTLIIADEGSYVHHVEAACPPASSSRPPTARFAAHERFASVTSSPADGRPHRVTAVQVRDLDGELFTFTLMSPATHSLSPPGTPFAIPRDEVEAAHEKRTKTRCA